MKADAVFEGGGVKCIGFAGAVCRLEEKGYQWESLAGTSAGSILASLLAVGYTGLEIQEILAKLDFKKFLSQDFLQSVPLLGKPLGLLIEKGIYSGDYIETWMTKLLAAKARTRFKDVLSDGNSRLKIIATDITKKDMLVLPDDLPKYGIDPWEFEIAKAVRMSTCIPFYFRPAKIKYRKNVSLILDGGLLSNYPIWIFDVDGVPEWPTFGFKFIEPEPNNAANDKVGVIDFMLDIVDTMISKDEARYIRDKDYVRTIHIPALDIGATDFALSREKSRKLFQAGYQSASQFLESWDFQEYIKKYRILI